jgi:hypothetical protein
VYVAVEVVVAVGVEVGVLVDVLVGVLVTVGVEVQAPMDTLKLLTIAVPVTPETAEEVAIPTSFQLTPSEE